MAANPDQERLDMGLKFFGRLTADVSHEIKNHLALINEFNGLIGDLLQAHQRGAPLNLERIGALVQDVKRQVNEGGKIVGALNRFAHGPDEDRQEIDLGSWLELFTRLARRPAELKGLSLRLELPSPPVSLNTRPFFLLMALHQGLAGLLEGAAKGEGLVLTGRAEPGRVLVSLGREQGGAGQGPGPVIAASLASHLGAQVASSRAGLVLSLPLGGGRGQAGQEEGTGKGTILLVDERPEFLAAMIERVAARGYQVTGAGDGAQALAAARGRAFDAVILDMARPDREGMETLQRLRVAAPETAFIVLTGHGGAQEVTRALAPGAGQCLVKPVDMDTLLARVEEAIALRGRPGAG